MLYSKQVRLPFLFFILFTSVNLNAQKQAKLSVEAMIGPSLPLGKFASKDFSLTNNSSGLAKLGFHVGATLKYPLNPHIGLQLILGGSFNSEDKKAYHDYINQGASSSVNAKIQAGTWNIGKALLGLYYSALIEGSRLGVRAGIAGGICKTSVPAYSWQVYNQSGTMVSEWQQDKASLPVSVAYQLSIGLQYKAADRIHYLLDLCFFDAKAKQNAQQQYSFSSVQAQVGIGFDF